ncbi:type IVB secretion system protein IcmH/DotU [Sulfitobacter pacificus]|uniref:type IVB secretion system protein IcmH/DotU n=1 Tax=Sulfitobacter pacificus TaxID=1499314 RepID=UPI0036073264
MRAAGPETGGSSNPLVRAASGLLILLGRLRTGLVDMQPAPLIDHVTREIDTFERNALNAGVGQQDAFDAKYALCATADDIVQNLPGADRGTWMEYSMVARFFGERSSGVGFFQKMDEAMRAPGQRFNLIELMLTCLSLGFEGQYRAMPNGSVELSRIARQCMKPCAACNRARTMMFRCAGRRFCWAGNGGRAAPHSG